MRPSECGFANPPADDTPEREIIDRFADFLREAGPADFLREAGPAATRDDVDAGRARLRTPAARYRLRFLAWRVSQVQ